MTQIGVKDGDAGEPQRCRWCRRPIDAVPGRGRPRLYCRQSCRQRDYEARSEAARHGLDEGDLIMARAKLDRLLDDVYVLGCAVEDARLDLNDASSTQELREILDSLIDAASAVAAFDANA